ncbi:MAG TPA: hypothetical protein DEQ77_04260 [Candidatus Omnitrophica bacterium]|nr:hypothetical protein [Candidatus Omnitrophota bacterium]
MKKHIRLLLCLALTVGMNLYFRSFPIHFPQFRKQAKVITEQNLYTLAQQQINKGFPSLSGLAKQNLINAFLADYKKKMGPEIKKQLRQEYHRLKDIYQDEHGQTYLMELDCWHWARYVENVYRLGHPGDIIIDGKQFDTLMFSPSGYALASSHFLFYLSAFLYKGFIVIKQIPLFTFLFYLPLFFSAIFITLLYLFCYQRWGNLAAIISCMFIGLSPSFVAHSSAGWFDMDILNLLFPFLTVWAYLKAYGSVSIKSRLLWICCASFWVGLLSFTWVGWWFIAIIILIYELFSFLYLTLKHYVDRENTLSLAKQHLFTLILFLFLCVLWIIFITGTQPLEILRNELKMGFQLNNPRGESIWPNTFHTVDELRVATFFELARASCGIPLFIVSLIALLYLRLRTIRDGNYRSEQREYIMLLLIWLMAFLYGCSKGSRFGMFLPLPLGIALGWVISDIYRHFRDKKATLGLCAILAVWGMANFEIINRTSRYAQGNFPLMNDAWYQVLTDIKKNTPPDAVLNSWWDFGDWFKVVCRRKVIFDGQSQQYPQAYWMARVLIANNEREAIGILRMLNNGGNKVFEILNAHLKDAFQSVFLIEKLILSEPKEAQEMLANVLPDPLSKEVFSLLYRKPPKAYFIVDPTMKGKMSSISYLGNWDFVKVFLSQHAAAMTEKQISDYFAKQGITPEAVNNAYREVLLLSQNDINAWLSRKSIFFSELEKAKEQNNTVFFNNGLVYTPKEKIIHIYSQGKYTTPKSLFLFDNNTFEEITYPQSDFNYSVLIFKKQDEYFSIILSPELAQSMFSRLYFLNGSGLKYFKPFLEEKNDEFGVKVFELDWGEK